MTGYQSDLKHKDSLKQINAIQFINSRLFYIYLMYVTLKCLGKGRDHGLLTSFFYFFNIFWSQTERPQKWKQFVCVHGLKSESRMTPRPSVMVVCNLVKWQRQGQQKEIEICGRGREETNYSVTERKSNRRGWNDGEWKRKENTRKERLGWGMAQSSVCCRRTRNCPAPITM